MLKRPWVVVGGVVVLVLLVVVSGLEPSFPDAWTFPLADRIDDLQAWVIRNRTSHPLFTLLFRPMALGAAAGLQEINAQLGLMGWPGVVLVVGVVASVVAGWRVAGVAIAALAAIGLLGQWVDAMVTLSLISVAVTASVAIGVPLGVVAGRVRWVEQGLRPILDAMQTIPAYVYLLPLVFLFGIGNAAAIVATIIYALPPVVRLTALGIRQVPQDSLELGAAVGTTKGQLLRTIQLPLALPSIRMGVNQTIMMALSMVVIGSLIGATGLGLEVLRGLQTLDIGRALDAGIAIVLLAVVLDRITYGAGARGHRLVRGWVGLGVIATALVTGRLLGALAVAEKFPFAGALSVAGPANGVESWARTELFSLTSAFSDLVIIYGLNPLRSLLLAVPWWLVAAIVAAIAMRVAGRGVALFTVLAFITIGATGMWPDTMNTLSQVGVATGLSIAIAIPIGIAASQSDGIDRTLRPLLDGMQTLPAFVYLIPVVALFNIGRVPGLIASVIYALPPAVRLTNAGIREVSPETVEAARSQGATRWQLLRTVQVPMARPAIFLGINQTTMMVLAGVIIAGLIGAGGLGIEAVRGLTRGEIGRGVEAGLAIVLVGIVLDRITQSLGGSSAESRETQRATFKSA